MAFFADPAGATICLWEPAPAHRRPARQHAGRAELERPDPPTPTARPDFYGGVFGWTFEEVPDAGGYHVIKNDDRENGGMMPRGDAPPGWMPYFGHEDVKRAWSRRSPASVARCSAARSRCRKDGSRVLSDPQGATFAAWTGDYDD